MFQIIIGDRVSMDALPEAKVSKLVRYFKDVGLVRLWPMEKTSTWGSFA